MRGKRSAPNVTTKKKGEAREIYPMMTVLTELYSLDFVHLVSVYSPLFLDSDDHK